MKYLIIIILVFSSFSTFSNGKKKEVKAEEIKELVTSQQFRFVANTASPRYGSSISLTSEYDLLIDSLQIEAWLPYFGRAYQADYGGIDGGIKFENAAKEMSIEMDKKKKNYLVEITVEGKKETYEILLNIGMSGYATLDVHSTYKQGISFYGTIEPIKEQP